MCGSTWVEVGNCSDALDVDISLRIRHVPHSSVNLSYVARRAFWIGRTRRYLKSSRVPLDVEYSLIRKIATGFLTRIVGGFIRDPRTAARQVLFVGAALMFTLLGFLDTNGHFTGRSSKP
jgi:hypothetical protein